MKLEFEYIPKNSSGHIKVTGSFHSDDMEECKKQFFELHPEALTLISADRIRKYRIVNSDTAWDCIVEIQEEKAKPYMKEMVEFWMDWEHDLKMNKGDYTITFLKMFARKILYLIISEDYNIDGVIHEISRSEGWDKMDGSCGIWILETDGYAIERSDFIVSEQKN